MAKKYFNGDAAERRARIDEAFPGRFDEIERACREAPSFQEVVDDFLECDRILRHLRAEGATANPRMPDYEEMWTRIEEEILTWLATTQPGSGTIRSRESR